MTPDQLRPGDVVQWQGVARVVHAVELWPGGGLGPDQWFVEWDRGGRGYGNAVMRDLMPLQAHRPTPVHEPEPDPVEAHPGQMDVLEALGVAP